MKWTQCPEPNFDERGVYTGEKSSKNSWYHSILVAREVLPYDYEIDIAQKSWWIILYRGDEIFKFNLRVRISESQKKHRRSVTTYYLTVCSSGEWSDPVNSSSKDLEQAVSFIAAQLSVTEIDDMTIEQLPEYVKKALISILQQ